MFRYPVHHSVDHQITAVHQHLLLKVFALWYKTQTSQPRIRNRHEQNDKKYRRSYMVNHTKEQIVDELSLIVDNGGKVLNVIVAHDVYGQIQADLILENRQDILAFYERMGSSKAGPLLQLSNGIHIHTVEAASERILDNIERDLRERGYLVAE